MSWMEENDVPCVFIFVRENSRNISTNLAPYQVLKECMLRQMFILVFYELVWPSTVAGWAGLEDLVCLPRARPGREKKANVHSLLHSESPLSPPVFNV